MINAKLKILSSLEHEIICVLKRENRVFEEKIYLMQQASLNHGQSGI